MKVRSLVFLAALLGSALAIVGGQFWDLVSASAMCADETVVPCNDVPSPSPAPVGTPVPTSFCESWVAGVGGVPCEESSVPVSVPLSPPVSLVPPVVAVQCWEDEVRYSWDDGAVACVAWDDIGGNWLATQDGGVASNISGPGVPEEVWGQVVALDSWLAAGGAQAAPSEDGAVLAFTGVETSDGLLLAAGLVLAGACLIVMGRRLQGEA